MVNVECPGCSAPYNVSEKRIPASGLKMRCPKCGESFVVNKPGGGGAAPGPSHAGPPRPGRPAARTQVGGASTGGVQSVGAPLPPPEKKPLFARGGGTGPIPRTGAATAMAGSLSIPALAEIGSDAEDDGFGVLDMSLPGDGLGFADGPADLPMSADQADLPMPAMQADLPMPVHARPPPSRGFADLPSRATQAGLPMVATEGDLPVPVAHGDLPMPAHYQDLPAAAHHGDLPLVARDGDLPIPARHGDLPMPARHGDLPLPARHGDLPAPARHGDLPMPARHGDLPLPAAHGDLPLPAEFGDLPFPGDGDLPAPHRHGDLPMPHLHGDLPIPNDQDLPLPFGDGDLPLPADQDFPLPAAHGDLPLPADFNLPQTAEGDLPIALDDDFPPPRRPASGGAFPGAVDAVGDENRHVMPPRREGSGVGDEFAIDEAEDGAVAGDLGGPMGADGLRVPLKKKKGTKSLRVAIAAISVFAVGGGLLGLTPLGPYGAYALLDTVRADSHQASLAAFRKSAQEQLAQDTAAEARSLFERARSELVEMPRFTPMAGYAAYLALHNNIRFGRDSASLASGRQLLVDSNPTDDMGMLAQAALAAIDGNIAEAQSKLAPVAQRLPNDIDVQVTAGEIALLAGAPKEAVAAWNDALQVEKNARTLFGLARAQHQAKDDAGALKSVDEVLKLSKNHAGARILKATLLTKADKTSEEAQKLLQEITDAGPVKSSASPAEQVEALSTMGSIYLSLGKMTEAEKAFKAALDVDSKSERALIGNGELFYAAGRYSEALARFKVAREVNAESIPAAVGIAKSMIKLERAKDARGELLALSKTSKNPLVGYWLGQCQEVLADRKAAEETYRNAIKEAPTHPDAVMVYVALADLLQSKGQNDEAQKILEEAGTKLKENAALHNAKGEVALKGGRLAEAKAEFEQALKLEPHNSLSRFRLAVAHRRAREFDAAKKILDELKATDPAFPGLMLEQGLLLQLTGKTEEALKIYTDALEKAPDDLDLKLRVGSTQVLSGFPEKALPLLQAVHAKRPNSAEVNHYLGRALFLVEDNPQQALTHLKLAAQLDASRADYQLWVAIVANSIRDLPVAEAAVEAALALDKNYGDAFWQKGVTLQNQGKTKDALDHLRIALAKNPTLFEAYASEARCYEDQANYSAAEEAWQKALDGDDSNPEWHFKLAKLQVIRGARDEALPHLKKSVELVKPGARPSWLWNAHYLLAETVRSSEPKTALASYKAFVKLTSSENAYRPEAEAAIQEIERQLLQAEHGNGAVPAPVEDPQ